MGIGFFFFCPDCGRSDNALDFQSMKRTGADVCFWGRVAGAVFFLSGFMEARPASAGTIRVFARDVTGSAGGYAVCFQWKDAERDFVFFERQGYLPEGNAMFTLPPGRYRVAYEYHGTVPRQAHTSEIVEVSTDTCVTQVFAFARAGLAVFARDPTGWAPGYATCCQWIDRERDFHEVDHAGPLANGKHVFHVPPGRYRILYEYRATVPRQKAESEPITLTNGSFESVDFLFPRASLSVYARDHAGWAPGHAICFQWQESERDFVPVDHRPFLDQGKCVFQVPPGRYRIQYEYRKSDIPQILYSPEVNLTNNASVDQEFYFPTGVIAVFAKSGDRWAPGILQFSEWDGQAGAFAPLRNKGYLSNGKGMLQVPPGRYRLEYEYRGQEPYQSQVRTNVVVTDGARLTCDFEFGPSGSQSGGFP